jgi:wyosine [tRNA(Phe)-imidazoG37] synthetase (radical SAM superfamily)
MSTFLFSEIVFGPVKSRRLGVSLGINLLPVNRKVCNFNCVYCECGWSRELKTSKDKIPSRAEVFEALSEKLATMKKKGPTPDVITFAGNGEPTLHPDFPGVIEDSISLRNVYFPKAEIAVLSNSTAISDNRVKDALMKVDKNILKLDSAFNSTIQIHNRPILKIDTGELIENLASFNGKLIIQTMFFRGKYEGKNLDNTTPLEIGAWLKALEKIKPAEVMIYTISRDTPNGTELEKIPLKELKEISYLVEELGIKTRVSA